MSETYEINWEWIAIHMDKKNYMYKTNAKFFLNLIRNIKMNMKIKYILKPVITIPPLEILQIAQDQNLAL